MPDPIVRVIVVNYNAGEYLTQCLQHLSKQTITDFEVVVLDCNSTDASFSSAQASVTDRRFAFEMLEQNLGFATACNRGVKNAESALIAFLNPDAIPAPDWLETLVSAAEEFPDADGFGSTQLRFEDATALDGAGDSYFAPGIPWRGGNGKAVPQFTGPYETFSVCAAAALYRRDMFCKLGGFDERYFCYLEDVDLGFRLRLAGGHCRQIPSATIRHVGGASSADDTTFPLYHGIRNSIWTFFKNMPAPLLGVNIPGHILILILLLFIALYRGNFRAALRGVLHGFTGLPDIFRTRYEVQRLRRSSTGDIARCLCWSPLAFWQRRIVRLTKNELPRPRP